MSSITGRTGKFSVRAYVGDFKTLLAFDIDNAGAENLAGFTIAVSANGKPAYYLFNSLQFKEPAKHAQDAREPANSSVNSPFQKLRWLHIPGSVHQGMHPAPGTYKYTVTPRYFDADGSLLALDPALSASVSVPVERFSKGTLSLGFTRGFTQSQAFVNHFGIKAPIKPKNAKLLFDTSQPAGTNPNGEKFTYDDEYEWSGFTAHDHVFRILNEVKADESLLLDVFAYDCNEPNFASACVALGKEGRIRIVLDNAALHKSNGKKKALEDEFERAFRKAAGGKDAPIVRGHFRRYSHDKVLIVSRKSDGGTKPLKVLTGSTNFSVTGMYVNANHVVIYDEPTVAQTYAAIFEEVFSTGAKEAAFLKTPFSARVYSSPDGQTPATKFTFAPHATELADHLLDEIAGRVDAESKAKNGSVLFAVMQLDGSPSPVWEALANVHEDGSVYSYGISDSPGGIRLYKRGEPNGVLVTGKPAKTMLPQPFNQVRQIGAGHEVHHKFVVCGFTGEDPVVYCGSSNLAPGGEANNGDNLLEIHDGDAATVFAIEAFGLVDHFNFLDRCATPKKKTGARNKPPADQTKAALQAHWYLSTTDAWAKTYFDPNDLHCVERKLLASPVQS